jgi:hypothetical protein
MQKKYRLDIYKPGLHNDYLYRMVTNHNAGRISFNLIDVVGFVNAFRALNPERFAQSIHTWVPGKESGTSLLISDDNGETFTICLTQVEISELQETVSGSINADQHGDS